MQKKVISGATIVNEGRVVAADVFIDGKFIERIEARGDGSKAYDGYEVIDANGLHLLPGVIDDQVHFREPGLTHKADIYTESRAAVAGGITSFMEMPNTVPNTLTQRLLQDKYDLAAGKSLANYSFYMGASNDNLEEVVRTDPGNVCGIKVFMGASTGNMLVDDEKTLEAIFARSPLLVAVHCEDEPTIRSNALRLHDEFGDDAPARIHPLIRSEQACFLSSSKAVRLARKHKTRLHILHLSTAREMELFDNSISLEDKQITAEVCVHHLWFSDRDYEEKENLIKWNPAVKSTDDRAALFEALLDDRIDVVATDHAPHTLEEKQQPFFKAPSGGPMVQHALVAMLEFVHQERLTIDRLVDKMCHNPARLFRIDRRGFIRKGYFADLVLVDLNAPWTVTRENLHYKCGWSPMEGVNFGSQVRMTLVNGHIAYRDGLFDESGKGERLLFNRENK